MTAIAITNAEVIPVDGKPFTGTVLVKDGTIAQLGPDITVPADAQSIDAQGRQLTPGLIDAHVHLGVHPEGDGQALNDTNETTGVNQAGVRTIDAIDPFEEGWDVALSGGVTTVNVLPGSGNPIGGQATAMTTFGRIVDEMVLNVPSGIKSALGENPKRVYGEKKQTPNTRLGVAKVIREAFFAARNYMANQEAAKAEGKPFDRDVTMEALAMVLRREIPWRQHCHRADDVVTAVRLSEEFGYRLVIDHGTEAHKVADYLAERNIPVMIGPLFTTKSKMELRGRSIANPGKLDAAGVEISLITDHPVIPISFLVHQASFAIREGLDRDAALRAVTINPAKVLGVDDRVGSLTVGKQADLVLWSGDWADPMARPTQVFMKGQEVYSLDEETRAETIASREL